MDTQELGQIVVIEDNSDLCDMLTEDLKMAGFSVLGYSSAEEWQTNKSPVDIFLLDINLPGMNGLEFAKHIRATDQRVGIIVLSVRTGSEMRTEGYQSGVDIYLQKPCGSVEVLAAVNRVAERVLQVAVPQSPTQPMSDQFILDVDKATIANHSGLVALTPREAKLIASLASADKQELSFEDCLVAYSEGELVKDATLEVGIGRLRKKLEPILGVSKSIVSVRLFGYRLILDVKVVNASDKLIAPS